MVNRQRFLGETFALGLDYSQFTPDMQDISWVIFHVARSLLTAMSNKNEKRVVEISTHFLGNSQDRIGRLIHHYL